MSFFGTKCPKCDSTNINTVRRNKMGHHSLGCFALLFFWPALFFMKKPKDLQVCRNCGFSWEK